MKTAIFRFYSFSGQSALSLASVDGNVPLWALSEPTADYIFETIEVPGVDFSGINFKQRPSDITRVTLVALMVRRWSVSH